MGFGGLGPSTTAALVGEVGELVEALEGAAARLSRVRVRLDGIGTPLAAIYVEGACDALAHAMEALLWSASRHDLQSKGPSVGTCRLRLRADGEPPFADLVEDVSAPPPATFGGRALGADLATSKEVGDRMKTDEVAAALMTAALSHSDWIHIGSGDAFRGDALAAHAVVATVTGRTSFPSLSRRQMDGLIHRGSAKILAGLGWRRLTGPAIPC